MIAVTKRFERFTEADKGEEVFLVDNHNGEVFSLPQTAASIWLLIDGQRDRASLVAAIARKHGVAETEIRADVDEFLTDLLELGLIGEA
ncbi:PqqD family protein [Sphingomonas sp. URHD0057]|uniref:PqqD family protein n=1 Tax=Sphingomonas sp. URHD0057 TaxID=1380389 RepID=UPI00048B71A8|nr:PqqD family protein [Sphingomonas sp. URHD0057]